ncbi:MAG: nucleotide exchange factor GrpE [Chitinophagales bacterium]
MSKKKEAPEGNNQILDETQQTPADEAALPIVDHEVNESDVLLKELSEQKEKYLRLLAEFENFKRRTARERIDFVKVAGQDVIKDLLPALDDMERAESVLNSASNIDAVKEGLNLITEKIRYILQSKGLRVSNPQGEEFNAEIMEAITEIPAPSEDLKGKVVDVLEKGYSLNDKIIRYAKVVVGK